MWEKLLDFAMSVTGEVAHTVGRFSRRQFGKWH